MFDAPLDAWYLWLGLGAVSLTVAGVAVGLPSTTAPDAAGVADAIDAVAASPYEAVDSVDIQADLVRLGSTRLSLRNEGRTSHATLAYGPVTPVQNGKLRAVLDGARPNATFVGKSEFRRTILERRGAARKWQTAPDELRIRRVSWGDVDATLVG